VSAVRYIECDTVCPTDRKTRLTRYTSAGRCTIKQRSRYHVTSREAYPRADSAVREAEVKKRVIRMEFRYDEMAGGTAKGPRPYEGHNYRLPRAGVLSVKVSQWQDLRLNEKGKEHCRW
jgi:hypothetical protein